MNKFPKPWRLEQADPGSTFAVFDANDRKLFFICEDDPEEGGSPAMPEDQLFLVATMILTFFLKLNKRLNSTAYTRSSLSTSSA